MTVWDSRYTGPGYGPLPVVVDVDAGMMERASEIADAVAQRARAAGVNAETIVGRGFPVDEICRLADGGNARLIVIGSHHWGRARRALLGSVSQGVVRFAHCAVIVVPAAPVQETEAKSSNKRLMEV